MRVPARHEIDSRLARRLVAEQFQEWSHLQVSDVELSGWDNKTFRLGDTMLIRLPSGSPYAAQVEKEHEWLPRLAEHLPFSIPTPLALGRPANIFPWSWSVYEWIEGEPAATAVIDDVVAFSGDVARFLGSLQRISPEDGPEPGWHCLYRGGDL
ncbi:MAG: phosphotransferase, partial [Actinomycetota bacterium]